MKYIITKNVYVDDPIVEITFDEYEQCRIARNNIYEVLATEEKLLVALDNYKDFEMELLDITFNKVLYHESDWSLFMENRNQINRKLVNLLSASRLYLDHLPHHINNIYGSNSIQLASVKKEKNTRYDGNFGYRVMEETRNYMLHRSFVITGLMYSSYRDEVTGFANNAIGPMINVDDLETDVNFKKNILAELKAIGTSVDIRPYVRDYIASIGVIQDKFRDIIKNDADSWEKTIKYIFSKYPTGKDQQNESISVVICGVEDSQIIPESRIYLLSDLIRRWKNLVLKSNKLAYLPNQVVTNEYKKH